MEGKTIKYFNNEYRIVDGYVSEGSGLDTGKMIAVRKFGWGIQVLVVKFYYYTDLKSLEVARECVTFSNSVVNKLKEEANNAELV